MIFCKTIEKRKQFYKLKSGFEESFMNAKPWAQL